jgi:hypothetical protein
MSRQFIQYRRAVPAIVRQLSFIRAILMSDMAMIEGFSISPPILENFH